MESSGLPVWKNYCTSGTKNSEQIEDIYFRNWGQSSAGMGIFVVWKFPKDKVIEFIRSQLRAKEYVVRAKDNTYEQH